MSDGLITNWNPSRMRESVDSSKVHAVIHAVTSRRGSDSYTERESSAGFEQSCSV